MRVPLGQFPSHRWLAETGLLTLTALFGLQTMRVFVPSVVYVYGEQPGVSSIQMGLYAFGIFLIGFLAAFLRKLLGSKASLAATAGGIAILRLVEQLSQSPKLDLTLTSLGTALFTLYLPLHLGYVRSHGPEATSRYAVGLLLGLALDTSIHGLFGTYDLSWQQGIGPALLVLSLVLIQLVLLFRTLTEGTPPEKSDASFLTTLPLMALGPLLFLQALIFQNIAQVTVLTGLIQPGAFALIALANAAGIALGIAAESRSSQLRELGTLLIGLVLGIALVFLRRGGLTGALGLLIGQICAAAELALLLTGLGARADRRGLWRTAIANGLGMFLFVLLVFAYYITYDFRVPYENAALPLVAAGILMLCATGAVRLLPQTRTAFLPDWRPVWVALALLAFPLGSWVTWRQPQPVTGKGWPVRVMTYNLHQGFDVEGRLGMEALARVIEDTRAEVVALQEVSRGWYINGSLDMLTWLSKRLNMPYVFGPTADPLWGNAILSRYPIIEYGNVPLPPDLPLRRGFLWARIDLGHGEEMLIIATHLHHVREEGHVRSLQVPVILEFWGGRDRTVILGDMNAEPGAPEIALYRNAGLRDAFAEIGEGPGYTFPSTRPSIRIDYILVSPDLKVMDLVIPQSSASDHLGIALTVSR